MKLKLSEKHKKAVKSYFHAVAASAIVMGVALLSELEPHYAVLIGALAGPAIKWADKHDKDFGLGSKE
jgi:hypothetical protein